MERHLSCRSLPKNLLELFILLSVDFFLCTSVHIPLAPPNVYRSQAANSWDKFNCYLWSETVGSCPSVEHISWRKSLFRLLLPSRVWTQNYQIGSFFQGEKRNGILKWNFSIFKWYSAYKRAHLHRVLHSGTGQVHTYTPSELGADRFAGRWCVPLV